MKPVAVRVIAVGAAVVAMSAATVLPAHADGGAAYTDSRAKGVIGLCDKGGKQVTSGSVTTKPFVWRAVSSEPAPDGYDGKGATATLYSYQPRKGVDAAYWSGDVLTAASVFSNPDHPMAAAVAEDEPLSTNLDTYPADWDGNYQLRLYLSAPGVPAYLQSYAATDLKIDGLTWKVINPQKVDCSVGTAVSNASLLRPKTTKTPAASGTAGSTPGATPDASTSATPDVAAGSGSDGGAAGAVDASNTASDSSGIPPWLLIVMAIAIAIGGFVGGQAIARRRASTSPPPEPGPAS